MIPSVSLRSLYLIFQQVIGLVLLMGHTSFTKDVELLVLRHEVDTDHDAHDNTDDARAGDPDRRRPILLWWTFLPHGGDPTTSDTSSGAPTPNKHLK
jgi:hypothetical protein